MTRPGTWVTAASRCTFFFPPAFRALALLAVDGDRGTRGNVPRVPARGGIQPRVGRVRPEPAVLAFLPEAGGGRRLALALLLPFFPLLPLPRLAGGVCRGDGGVEGERGQCPGQRGLQLVGVQQPSQAVQGRGRRGGQQPGPRAAPAAVRLQHVLVPAGGGLRDRQHPGARRRDASDQHRYQRRQRVPPAPRLPLIGQPLRQRLPERHRARGLRSLGQVAAQAVHEP